MSSHPEIQRRLPAYCGGDLEPAERQLVEGHLAACPACRAELADLQTALRLIRSTPEVDPPPWLTGRIMARIREQQAGKRSWLQRMFLPLHIKLPLEAMALLMVCLSGYYLTRSVETNLEQANRQQLQEFPAQQAPLPSPPPAQPPPRGEKAEPPTASRPQTAAPIAPPRLEGLPDKTEQHTPTAPAPPTYAPAPPAFRQEQSAPAAGSLAAPPRNAPAADSIRRTMEAAPEMKKKGAKGFMRPEAETMAPAPFGKAADQAVGTSLPQLTVRITPADRGTAAEAIRLAASRSGALVVDDSRQSAGRITLRVPAARLAEFGDQLARIGRVSERPEPPAGAQTLEVTVQW